MFSSPASTEGGKGLRLAGGDWEALVCTVIGWLFLAAAHPLTARGRARRAMECKQSLTALFSTEKGRGGKRKINDTGMVKGEVPLLCDSKIRMLFVLVALAGFPCCTGYGMENLERKGFRSCIVVFCSASLSFTRLKIRSLPFP